MGINRARFLSDIQGIRGGMGSKLYGLKLDDALAFIIWLVGNSPGVAGRFLLVLGV